MPDVDKFSMGIARCHRSQECINTIGSYKCVAGCEKGFKRTTDGLACIGERKRGSTAQRNSLS